GVRPGLDQDRRSRADGATTGAALAHRQAFLAVEPVDPVLARRLALTSQQHEQPAIAEPSPLDSQGAQPLPQRRVRLSAGAIAHRFAVRLDDGAGPPFADLERRLQVGDGLAHRSGPYHFFESRSFSAALSSMASASRRFSFPFSSSRARRRWASDTLIPPNLAFQA